MRPHPIVAFEPTCRTSPSLSRGRRSLAGAPSTSVPSVPVSPKIRFAGMRDVAIPWVFLTDPPTALRQTGPPVVPATLKRAGASPNPAMQVFPKRVAGVREARRWGCPAFPACGASQEALQIPALDRPVLLPDPKGTPLRPDRPSPPPDGQIGCSLSGLQSGPEPRRFPQKNTWPPQRAGLETGPHRVRIAARMVWEGIAKLFDLFDLATGDA